jgi:membrane protein YdbS with pleckstrin-like domain
MTCSQCGAEAPANAAFCPKCGAQLGRATAAGIPPAPAARMQGGVAQGAARDVPEEELWSGSYSPKTMTGWYIVLGILAIVGIVVTYNLDPNAWIAIAIGAGVIIAGLGLYAAYKHMSVRYQLTTHRFVIQSGVLSRTDNRILLVDVDDISVHQGMVERMFNLGTIHLRTTDETTREESPDKKDPVKGLVIMDGIENPRQVADLIDESRRAERTRRGVYMMNA